MPPQTDSGNLNNLKAHKGGTVSPSKSSKRTAATADQDFVDKATKLKAKRNMDTTPDKGTLQGNAMASTVGKIAAA